MMKFNKFISKNGLLIGTLGGVFLGFISGILLREFEPTESAQALISYPGEIFFRALKLMILPSVVFSLITGSASLNISSNGKIAARTFTYFLATSFFNTILGVVLAVIFHPGNPIQKDVIEDIQGYEGSKTSFMDNMFDLGRNIIPSNIITPLFESTQTMYKLDKSASITTVKIVEDRKGTNFLGVIVISIVIGSVLSTLGKQAKPLLDVISICEVTITKIVRGIMWTTPIGVASLICGKIIEVPDVGGLAAQLGLFVVTVSVGILMYQLVFMQLFYFAIIRKNPFKFYFGVLPASMTGFAVQSSSGALPVTLQCLDENVKLDPRISRFVVPLGITINMDGTAMFVSIASVFTAQMNNVSLDFQGYLTVCILGTTVSIATSTTPSAALAIIFIILQALGLPVQDIGLLYSIDWFLDRLRITNNVLGDCYTAAIVQHLSLAELKSIDPQTHDTNNITMTGIGKCENTL